MARPPPKNTYQTPRHDFFVSKLYYLPRLVPGRYSLQLTIEDTLGHKAGQSSIDFTVKPQRSNGRPQDFDRKRMGRV